MALKSFIKKIFSFGSKKVEEVEVDGVTPQDDSAIREAEVRAAEEKARAEAEEAARKEAEEKAVAEAAERAEAERQAAEEQAAKAEAERKAAEEAERAKAEAAAREKEKTEAKAKAKTKAEAAAEEARLAREREQERVREATRQREEERKRALEAQEKAAAERKAAAEKAKADARRKAEEEKAKAAEAERREAEERKRAEAEQKARAKAEVDTKTAAEAEARARAEAEERRKAKEEAARTAEAERKAGEAAKAAELERKAEEEARQAAEAKAAAEAEARAKEEAEKRAAEEAARVEAERQVAEQEAARAEAERSAAEAKARAEAEAEAARKAAAEAEAVEQARLKAEQDSAAARPAGKVTVTKTVAEAKAPEPAPASPPQKKGWLQRLREGLSRSSRELTSSVTGLFTKRKLDEDTLQDLEDILIRADLGLETAIRITDALSQGRYGKNIGDDEVRAVMAAEIEKVLTPVAQPLELDLSHKPHVILVVGVNGTGKTTTIGKLAAKLRDGGLDVMLAAGDTFRAAAIEQLHIWGERVGAPVISSKLGADAAGLAFDAFKQAKEAGSDVLIIDTAGRLQNRTELMDELAKIVRVLGKLDPEAPHTVLQTLDATTGQNALSQVEIFRNVAGVNGLVMTKLDGTARGGIMVAIAARHKLPVYFVGVGEQVDDLEPFEAKDFAKAIVGEPLQEPA